MRPSTEAGCLTVFAPKSTNINNWRYFKFSGHFKAHLTYQDSVDEGEIGELIALVRSSSRPVNTSLLNVFELRAMKVIIRML